MREELAGFHKISIYGTRQEIDHAKLWLVILPLTEVESTDRLVIQDCIDKHKLRASILYSGNQVWSYQRVIDDFKYVLKHGMNGLPKRLYEFLHLCCGSIAHYNLAGRVNEYPTTQDLRAFLIRNEFGKNALKDQPNRKTDTKRILEGAFSLFNIQQDELTDANSFSNW